MSEQSSVVVFGRAGEVVPSCPSCARLRAEAEQIRAEIEEMRLSAKKMHRRCQAAEKIADAKIEKWEDQKRSLGRALANSACTVLMAQRDEARAEVEALTRRVGARGQIIEELIEVVLEDEDKICGEWCCNPSEYTMVDGFMVGHDEANLAERAMNELSLVEALLVDADVEAMREAARWVLHVANGIGKSGGEPEDGEMEAALDALKEAKDA